MPSQIKTGTVHNLRLTVTDVDRAREFYTGVLGFQVAMELPSGVLLTNGSVLLGLGPAPIAEQRSKSDRFDENRVGLDHLSFSVASRDELDHAVAVLDARRVLHGEIKDLGPSFGIYVLMIRDPDNIQLELSAPYSK